MKRLSKQEYEILKKRLASFYVQAFDLDRDFYDEFYTKFKGLADMTLELKILKIATSLSKVLADLNEIDYYLEIERKF